MIAKILFYKYQEPWPLVLILYKHLHYAYKYYYSMGKFLLKKKSSRLLIAIKIF